MTDSASLGNPETPGPRQIPAAQLKTIPGALTRYRTLAWITGVWLLVLVVEMIAKYGFDVDGYGWVGIAHGWVYFVYLIMTVDLGIRARWGASKIITTAIAGTIPFLSFWFERVRTREVKQEFKL